ncbi:MAG: glycosyltransferase family 2 protein [Ruminococcus sp.]|uniref:Glycosyltransferase family 2 protein n=1 Tax=Schaedlerella arabinosiphila TaxID=2044587 RepID=A0A426DC88_9FIRM|nr:glycosyltransferase family 2 protein [Schaedlerella arabinosiphila]MCI8722793.1 glycosyltransferase family 2 protein [Ruminococcus sp.]RRK30285.1 glycosyltransferase family 2 protein [Schaedlerella arabinosiphila]
MISIIIPVYNTEQYLRRCINSILDSSCGDFEIILVNDGSTDNSPAICEEYSCQDSRIKVIHQENRGVSSARNHGLDHCQGEWVVFVDSDDFISRDFLNLIARETYQNQDLLLFDFAKFIAGHVSADYPVHTVSFSGDNMLRLIRRILVPRPLYADGSADFRSPCARAYKKSIIDRYSIRFSPSLTVGEDLLFNMEYQLRARSCVYTSVPVYFYDIHEGSATHGFRSGLLKNHARLQRQLKKLLEQCRMFPVLENEYYSYCLENLTYVLIWEVFSPSSPRPYHTKCRMCARMRKNPIYAKAMKYNWKNGILPRKILVFFFRLSCWPITDLICRASYMHLKGNDF